MNPESYFEEEPWEYAVDKVKNSLVGEIAAVAVQAVCEKGMLNKQLNLWQARLDSLLGQPLNVNILSSLRR